MGLKKHFSGLNITKTIRVHISLVFCVVQLPLNMFSKFLRSKPETAQVGASLATQKPLRTVFEENNERAAFFLM